MNNVIKNEKLEITFEGFERKYDPFDLFDKLDKIKSAEGDPFSVVRQFRDTVIEQPTMSLSQAVSAISNLTEWFEDAKKNIKWMQSLQPHTESPAASA